MATKDPLVSYVIGECTITLKDVAYQLGLPINDELVSGCLSEFDTLMPDGAGRPHWGWFDDLFGELPHQSIGTPVCFTTPFELEFPSGGSHSSTASTTLGDTGRVLLLLAGYTRLFAEQLTRMWSLWQARCSSCRTGSFGIFNAKAIRLQRLRLSIGIEVTYEL
ncbi:hypothetical protein PIB30_001127 [Stylosanthes scabra]|uniref:Uncharacterized protein n=1 Tax=Stylosanthes scabra TaxID=79078 RepID=A0ABU6U3G5_9FABA|nr:hypothetical protein [Stylosanthes scabra]